MKLALKIDVETLRGTREGVPVLIDILQRHGAGATFLFSLGPDPRARMFGRDIGRRAGDLMRHVRGIGFETGVHAHDALRWKHRIVDADPAWIDAEMQRAVDAYARIFGEPPRVHGAAGWRMNAHALRLTQRLGFDYCSDGRGHGAHLPVWNAELIRCPQFPTTLPTAAELLAAGDVGGPDHLAGPLLERTGMETGDHVYNAFAELEGGALAVVFERLLVGWKAQGYALVALRELVDAVEPLSLPRHEVGWGAVPGCAHKVLVQQQPFLADIAPE